MTVQVLNAKKLATYECDNYVKQFKCNFRSKTQPNPYHFMTGIAGATLSCLQ